MAASSWSVPAGVFLAVWGAVLMTKGTDDQCPKLPQCSCVNTTIGLNISCRNVSDFATVQEGLVSQFANETINRLYIKNCSVTLVPSRVFANLSIYTLLLQCPLQEIRTDAFEGVSGLLILRLAKTLLPVVPAGLQAIPDIVQFELTGGKVQKLDDELHNLTSLHSLSLTSNEIREITTQAFRDAEGLNTLDLSRNKLQSIGSGVVDGLTVLEYLDLDRNYLTTVDGLFQTIRPKYISLNENKLKSLENAFPHDMSEVLTLRISDNPLHSLPADVFLEKFANLQTLELKKDQLNTLDVGLFAPLTSLTVLDLSANSFLQLPSTVFQPLANLTSLSLSNNRMSSVADIFNDLTQLQTLNIGHNQLESVDNAFVNLKQLSILLLPYNRMTTITERSFRGLENLDILNVQFNKISNIETNSFANLSRVSSIFLDGNSIKDIGQVFNHLPNLVHLTLDFNRIETLVEDNFVDVPKLGNVSLFRNKLDSIYRTFWGVDSLVSLNISRNALKTLFRDAFPEKMHFLELKVGYYNPWSCDCRIRWLIELLQSLNDSDTVNKPRCVSPPWQTGLLLTDVNVDSLALWPKDCPGICTCTCQPSSRDLLISVDCSDRALTAAPEPLPSVTGELLLNDNLLVNISAVNLSLFQDLKNLNLEDNVLTSLDQDFPPTLKVLQLAGNNLTRLSVDAVARLNLTNVSLSRNPWICDCAALHFKQWIADIGNIVVDRAHVKCGPDSESMNLVNRSIYLLADTDLCPSTGVPIYIIIIICVAVAVVIILTVTIAKLHVPAKVWLYAHGVAPVKRTEDLQGDHRFHAFLSYSTKDEPFIAETLLPGLEDQEPHFKICLQYKHFVSGKSIRENLFDCSKCSLRTILVVSRNFLLNEWQIPEFRDAHMELASDKSIRRIAIVGGDIPPFDQDMNTCLKSCTRVYWRRRNFWNRLRYAMPRVASQSRTQDQNEIIVNSNEITPLLA